MANTVSLKRTFSTFVLLAIMAIALPSIAQKKNKKPKDDGQEAVVVVDGAAVYSVANFDAPVKEYLDRGKKYMVSQKIYPGIGGLGTFYKIRLRQGVFGYITDVDVEVSGKKGSSAWKPPSESNDGDPLKIQDDLETDPSMNQDGDTVYLTKYIGASVTSASYAETLANKKRSTNVMLLGLRRSGPTGYLGGMPLDLELAFTSQVPDFYNQIATESSGYLFLGSALAMFPLVDNDTKVIYYAFGPMVKYSMFDVKLRQTPSLGVVDSQEAALGGQLALGIGMGLGTNWVLRVDARYIYEQEAYSSFSLAIQRR